MCIGIRIGKNSIYRVWYNLWFQASTGCFGHISLDKGETIIFIVFKAYFCCIEKWQQAVGAVQEGVLIAAKSGDKVNVHP